MFTALFASPIASERRQLWQNLDGLQTYLLWLIIGDFNCVMKGEERSSGEGVSDSFAQ